MPRIIPRSEWGARYGDGAGQAQLPATEVYIHHSVTVAPDMVLPRDDDYEAIRRLDQIGADTFGEQYGISYTLCITPAGLIFEGHSVDQMGAHTKGHNWTARAICFVGNYEENELTEQQIQACAWLLQHGHAQGWWTQSRLTGGHRDVYSTACPGQHAYDAIGHINELASQPPEEAEMGSVPQTLPHSQEWTYAAFPVECGGSSRMIDQMWFTITSMWGATEYVLVMPDGQGGFTGPQSGGGIGSWEEPTTVESDTRRAYKLHEGIAAVGIYYRNKGGNTVAGVAFPQM